VKRLLSYAEERQQSYTLFPKLLSLVVSNCPQLFGVSNLLMEEEDRYSTIKEFTNSAVLSHQMGSMSFEEVKKALQNAVSNPLQTILVLKHLSTLLPSELYDYVAVLIEDLLPQLLESNLDYTILRLFQSIWSILYSQYSWEIGLKFLNQVKMPGISFTHLDLIGDPLLIFKIDERVFKIPTMMQVLLQILGSYLAASRKHYGNQAQLLKKPEEINTLILAQESAVVQQLLEICLLPSEEQGLNEETRVLICTFLHDSFIENPSIIKIVHFQSYAPELLPITVAGIPSMHICLEFIPELLSHPKIETQIFGILLGAHLIEKYPIARSLDMAKLILSHVRNTSAKESFKQVPTPSKRTHPNFLLEVVPSLELLCNAFPLLSEEVVTLLLAITPSTGVAERTIGFMRNPELATEITNVFQRITSKLLSKAQS